MKREAIPWSQVGKVAGAGGAVALGASLAASFAGAWYFARVLLTPEREKPDNTVVLDVEEHTITLRLDTETAVRGHYGLWLDGGRTHVRVGEILEVDRAARRVVRELLSVDLGTPAPGPGRWSSHIYVGTPAQSLGLASCDAVVPSDLGDLPAWIVPGAPTGSQGGRWAVLVHGRGAMREECLRAVPTLHAQGITCLVASYRNDSLAPPSPDGLIALGLTEWLDVEACIRFCVENGADDVLLCGWSMGGAVVLQALARSDHRDRIAGVVLDGPVIDWVEVMEHQARQRRLPRLLVALVRALVGDRWTSRLLVGLEQPLDLATTRWQVRADELQHPILLIHSRDDDVVPVGASADLARLRPDVVRFEEWQDARHVKEWNVDPERWNRVVADFVTHLPTRPGAGRAHRRIPAEQENTHGQEEVRQEEGRGEEPPGRGVAARR